MTKRKVTNYTTEFKESSAKLAAESEQSIVQTAKELGLNISTLHGWVRKYHPNNRHGLLPSSPPDEVQVEIKRLKKELTRVTQERDILKKAAAYFASEAL
jgi:transposase